MGWNYFKRDFWGNIIKVFIVEDEVCIQTLYKRFFSLLDVDLIDIASNGEEAIEMFKDFHSKSDVPDIIIMDYQMPIKNGIEATREILQIDRKVKIIFISADESIRELALSIGAYSFITKPFRLKTIIEIIEEIKKVIDES